MINVPCSEDCTSSLPRKSFGSLSLELILLSKSPKTNLIKIRFFLFEKFSKYVVHYKLNLFLLCRTCYLLFVYSSVCFHSLVLIFLGSYSSIHCLHLFYVIWIVSADYTNKYVTCLTRVVWKLHAKLGQA